MDEQDKALAFDAQESSSNEDTSDVVNRYISSVSSQSRPT